MCTQCGWKRFCADIENLISQSRFRKSETFLQSVLDTVRKNEHATEKQAEAVDRIERRGF